MDKINYIFDLDGTIINSSNEVLNCFERAFETVNYPIDKTRLTSDLIGPPLRAIIKNIVPELNDENILDNLIKKFREIYDNDMNDISVLYDGIYDKLLDLKKQNKRLFLATLKPQKPTNRILCDFKLNMFNDVYTIDKFPKQMTKKEMIIDIINKYNLDKSETVMIGDAVSDAISAKDAGIDCIGVLWGYEKDKADLINNSTFVIGRTEEI